MKKKDKLQQKKQAFRSKLNVAHAEIRARKAKQVGKSQRKRDKKKRRSSTHLLDFSGLAGTLEGLGDQYSSGDAAAVAMKDVTVKSTKQRESIMREERGRMDAVLHHPVFQNDPLKAVMSHLTATLAPESAGTSMQ